METNGAEKSEVKKKSRCDCIPRHLSEYATTVNVCETKKKRTQKKKKRKETQRCLLTTLQRACVCVCGYDDAALLKPTKATHGRLRVRVHTRWVEVHFRT